VAVLITEQSETMPAASPLPCSVHLFCSPLFLLLSPLCLAASPLLPASIYGPCLLPGSGLAGSTRADVASLYHPALGFARRRRGDVTYLLTFARGETRRGRYRAQRALLRVASAWLFHISTISPLRLCSLSLGAGSCIRVDGWFCGWRRRGRRIRRRRRRDGAGGATCLPPLPGSLHHYWLPLHMSTVASYAHSLLRSALAIPFYAGDLARAAAVSANTQRFLASCALPSGAWRAAWAAGGSRQRVPYICLGRPALLLRARTAWAWAAGVCWALLSSLSCSLTRREQPLLFCGWREER